MGLGSSGQGMRLSLVSGGSKKTDAANQKAKQVETIEQIVTASIQTEDAQWGPKPSVPDQLLKFPTTCRIGAPEFRIFVVTKQEDATSLNELLAQAHPPSEAQIQISGHKEYFSDAKASVIVTLWFKRISYLQLDKPAAQKLEGLLTAAHLSATAA